MRLKQGHRCPKCGQLIIIGLVDGLPTFYDCSMRRRVSALTCNFAYFLTSDTQYFIFNEDT